MLKTREELTIELAKSTGRNEGLSSLDLKTRKEFARAFGWSKPKRQYDSGDAELYEPTWVEIFVELGKLLAARNFKSFEGRISELEVTVGGLEESIIRQEVKKPV